jgi:hypothetical protein
MAHNFQKIKAPFGRKSPKDRMVDESVVSLKWVEAFKGMKFWASEKIDGTSVGIKWDGERISFIGHTDKSQFNPRYLEYLQNRFGTPEFESCVEMIFGDKPVIIYGEGISKDYNVHYGFPEGEFIMYDISIDNGKFAERDVVYEVASKLDIKMPFEARMTLDEAIEYVKARPQSVLNSEYKMEGLVLRPMVELYLNNGERVITKIKVKDFVDCKDYKSE